LLVTLVAAACALPGSALAIEFRSLTGSFGPDGTSGSSFTEYLGPLAFDQGNKHLYALDQETQKIHGFDASTPGTHPLLGGAFPLSAPGAAELDDIAVNSSTHGIYYASQGAQALYGFDESGNALTNYPKTGIEGVCGTAVDPLNRVWAVRFGSGTATTKRYNSSNPGDFDPFIFDGIPCRIAFDSEENLFLAEVSGAVREFTAASEYDKSSAKVIDPGFSYAIAVDRSTNELYVVHEKSISVYDDTGTFLYAFGGSVAGRNFVGSLGGIAIDEASEEVFVSDSGHTKIDVFGPPFSLPKTTTEGADGITAGGATVHGTINPRGLAVEDCHFEVVPASQFIAHKVEVEKKLVIRKEYEEVTPAQKYPCVPAAGSIPVDSNPHAVSANVTGLNPATVYHYRLVAKNTIGEGHGVDHQFTTGPTAPLVEEESVEAVGTGDATVSAKINPRGGETTYHVEYGTTNAYGQSTAESAPFGFSSDAGQHPVSVHIGGLQPGTAYHFRFVATNPVGGTVGSDTSFATYPATSPTFAPCPNDQFRTGPGSRLPDCRAYEQGTPIDKHGANAQFAIGAVSPSGDRFTFPASGGLPTTGGSSELVPFLASRGPGGWSSDGFLPLTEPGFRASILGVNEDLSAALVIGEGPGGVGKQLFLRDSETATFQPGPSSNSTLSADSVQFASSSHLIFVSQTQLLPSAPAGKRNLYDLDHGALTLADRIPAGSAIGCDDEAGPACVVPTEGMGEGSTGKISRDGSRVFFTVRGPGQPFASGRLYMREDGAKTTWISASQRTIPDPGGEKQARLISVTPDGSKAFFTSCEKLTNDSTAHSSGANACAGPLGVPSHGEDLYSYDAESGQLTDLTVDSNAGDPMGAGVQTALGTSEDSSYVYFAAEGALAPGASHGECMAENNKCNLYVYHGGVTKFIAQTNTKFIDYKVSADGSALLFGSSASLTGYNNHGTTDVCGAIGSPCTEFFRYGAPEEKLLCVTCNPTGLPPTRGPGLGATGKQLGSNFVGGSNLSADGNRFFFESPDALVPGDTNHVTDVYEWEAKGTGTCESESQDGGCLYLISSGTDPVQSAFLGASKNGDHVFFFTEAQLVPTDLDQLIDVYDAGVGAGLAAQHTLAPPSCASTACQANPPPPPDPSLASAAYSGAGNVHSAAKGRKCPKGKRKVRSGGKVRCQKASKQHKRHNNRGGSK
jgi:hypothetical protein